MPGIHRIGQLLAGVLLVGWLAIGVLTLLTALARAALFAAASPPAPAAQPAPVLQLSASPPTEAAGWTALEQGDAATAVRLFTRRLRARPQDPETRYGLGYSLLESGDPRAALPHLCAARASEQLDTRREVDGLLGRLQLSCP